MPVVTLVLPLSAREETFVTLSGGSVESLFADDFGVIEVHGSNLELGDGRLTGVLADGTLINAMAETDGTGQIVLVPEPFTLTMLLGAVLLATFMRSLRVPQSSRFGSSPKCIVS